MLTEENLRRPKHDPLVSNEWPILLKSKVSKRSSGRSTLKSWWTKRMFRTSTNLRIPRSEKIGFEGVLGALKVISLSAHFCNVKIMGSQLNGSFRYMWLPI